MGDSKNPRDILASQRQFLATFAAAESNKLLMGNRTALLQAIAEAEGFDRGTGSGLAETIARLKPQLDDFFPLGRLQGTISAHLFAMKVVPETHLAAMTAWSAQIKGITAAVVNQLEVHDRVFRGLNAGPRLQEMFTESFKHLRLVEQMSIDLPQLALKNWPLELAFQRSPLIEDLLRNVAALQEFHSTAALRTIPVSSVEHIEAATHLVQSHGNFVRRLPPALPNVPNGEDQREQVGPQLETRLRQIDPRLVELRRAAWKNLANGKAGALLAAHGMREILTMLLHTFAPDEEVRKTDIWLQREEQTAPTPTRRMRFEYIVGTDAADLAAFIQLTDSVKRGQKFAHTFIDDVEVVRAHLAQMEACIYLVTIYAMERKGGQ